MPQQSGSRYVIVEGESLVDTVEHARTLEQRPRLVSIFPFALPCHAPLPVSSRLIPFRAPTLLSR